MNIATATPQLITEKSEFDASRETYLAVVDRACIELPEGHVTDVFLGRSKCITLNLTPPEPTSLIGRLVEKFSGAFVPPLSYKFLKSSDHFQSLENRLKGAGFEISKVSHSDRHSREGASVTNGTVLLTVKPVHDCQIL